MTMRTSPELTDELDGAESSAPAIAGWLAVAPVSVRASLSKHATVTAVMQRLPRDVVVEPRSRPAGYRDPGGVARSAAASKSLADLAKRFREVHGLRFRSRGARLVPRWLERVRAVVIAGDPADAGAELRITGVPGEVALVCVAAVAELGPCALTVGERSVRVDTTTTTAAIRLELSPPPSEDRDRSPSNHPATGTTSRRPRHTSPER